MVKKSYGKVRPNNQIPATAVLSGLDRSVKSVLCGLVMAASLLGVNAPVMAQDLVNINTDSPEVMSAGLQGVGLAKAYRIVEYRQAFGPFESVDELAEVKGIGETIIEQNRAQITLD